MNPHLRYEGINLGETLDEILENDFWIMRHISAGMLRAAMIPLKFESSSSIFLRRGSCEAEINLIRHHIEAPAIINIGAGQVLQPSKVSEDFDAGFVVLSKKMVSNMLLSITDTALYSAVTTRNVVAVPADLTPEFEAFYACMVQLMADKSNPSRYQAIYYSMLGFFFRISSQCYGGDGGDLPSRPGRVSEAFLRLVRENFRQHRFLDFYAERLQITTKHLSRTLKQQTGHTAVEWIERFVVLEAKILLKSSTLSIQQISDELNFPSQSFFGKYFKKKMGMSPREFRNK